MVMSELEKKAWIENYISLPGPATKRLLERLLKRKARHALTDDKLQELNDVNKENSVQGDNISAQNAGSDIQHTSLKEKIASYNSKYDIK